MNLKEGSVKMANIANFTTPTGQSGNLFKPTTWIPLVIGSGVLLAAIALGQKGAQFVHSKVPAIPSDPYTPFQNRPTPSPASQKQYIG
jgi:hypothetical protein